MDLSLETNATVATITRSTFSSRGISIQIIAWGMIGFDFEADFASTPAICKDKRERGMDIIATGINVDGWV